MGLKAAFSIAAALIIGPILALIGYKHWLNTRTFNPLDIPVSLSRGHIRTPEFYINLKGHYDASIHVDYAATYTPGCQSEAWESLRMHLVAYKSGLNIGEADWPGPRYQMGLFAAEKNGYYSLGVEVLSDGACLNAYHPRLIVWNISDFPYDDLYERGAWFLPVTTAAGLGLIIYAASSVGRSSARKPDAITESDDARVTTGLPPRRAQTTRLISGLPHFPLICATVLGLVVFVMMVLTADVPPRGIYVSLLVKQPRSGDPDSLTPPIIVRVEWVAHPPFVSRVYVNSKAVEWDRLKMALQDELKLRPTWVVYVDADANSSWQSAVDVMNIARELHAKVVLLTPETRKLVEPCRNAKRSSALRRVLAGHSTRRTRVGFLVVRGTLSACEVQVPLQ